MHRQHLSARVGAVALSLALFATPALAVDYGVWDSWDTVDPLGIDYNEYESGLDEVGVFDEWDADNDGFLAEKEFNDGVGDNDDVWDSRFGGNAFFDWDADDDNRLSKDEFYENSYAVYDADDDNVIEEPEFGDLGDDAGDGGLFDV